MFSISRARVGARHRHHAPSLLQVERLPIRSARTVPQASLQKVDDAWGQVTTRLSSLRAAVDPAANGPSFADAGRPPHRTTRPRRQRHRHAEAGEHHLHRGPARHGTGCQHPRRRRRDGTPDFTSADRARRRRRRSVSSPRTARPSSWPSPPTRPPRPVATSPHRSTRPPGSRARVVRAGTGDFRLVLSGIRPGRPATSPSPATCRAHYRRLRRHRRRQTPSCQFGNLQIERSSNTVTDLIDGVTSR